MSSVFLTDRNVWRHRKGGVYTVVGMLHGDIIYVAHADGARWRRDAVEFMDGRFEKISDATPLSDTEAGISILQDRIIGADTGLEISLEDAAIRRG